MKFGGSLARNEHFGSFFCANCRRHRAKRSFWNLVLCKLSEASHEAIILEAFCVKIVRSIVQNDHFGSFLCENSQKLCVFFLWFVTQAPLHKHHRKNTTTRTPPQEHHHTNTKNTMTPPQKEPPHHHKNTGTRTPPHKHDHTTTRTSPQKHYKCTAL